MLIWDLFALGPEQISDRYPEIWPCWHIPFPSRPFLLKLSWIFKESLSWAWSLFLLVLYAINYSVHFNPAFTKSILMALHRSKFPSGSSAVNLPGDLYTIYCGFTIKSFNIFSCLKLPKGTKIEIWCKECCTQPDQRRLQIEQPGAMVSPQVIDRAITNQESLTTQFKHKGLFSWNNRVQP